MSALSAMSRFYSFLTDCNFSQMETKKLVFFTATGVASVYIGFEMIKNWVRNKRLRKAIRNHRHERNSVIEQLRMKLDLADDNVYERRQWIISLSLTDLINELQQNNVGPVEVLEAYQWRAIKAHDLTNCVCLFIIEANDWAEEMEQKYRDSDTKPPLYGVPISIKESLQVKGYDATRGYANEIGMISQSSSYTVSLLQQFGAIPFVKTNIPQSLLSFNCSNPVYGKTSHPADPNRTCGGSSGGEAALIAMSGSLLGVGGDVGGSIRIPSHFCGIAGLKPSHIRMSQAGSKTSVPGRPMLCASIGPMAKDVDSLALFLKTLLCPDLYFLDPYVAPVAFRDELYEDKSEPLTIGYYDFDGFMPATPACKRAVRMAKDILENAGHKLVHFDPPNIEEAFAMFIGAGTVDGGQYLVNLMKNDIIDPYYSFKIRLYSLPIWLKRLLYPVVGLFSKDFGMAFKGLSLNTSELRAVYENIGNYRQKFLHQWKLLKLDAVICPPCATTAMAHEYPEKCAGAVSYSMIFNLLDFAAGVVPVTRVSSNDEKNMTASYDPIGYYAKIVKEDASSNTIGLPVGVQCAALPFNEEICLRVLKEIESGVTKTGY